MPHQNLSTNPFALMLTPETIFAAIERSERLSRLKSRICRPLDGPRPPVAAPPDIRAFDASVDASVDAAAEVLDWPEIQSE